FNDRIEFFNPGGLPKSVEELKAKDLSIPRNPIITKLFRMVRLAENAGFGLDKIDKEWFHYNGTTPEMTHELDSTTLLLEIRETDKITDIAEDKWSEKWRERWGEKWGEKWGERWGEKWPEIERWWKKE